MPVNNLKDHEVVCKCENGDVTVSIDHYHNNKASLKLADGMAEQAKSAEKYMNDERKKMAEDKHKNKSK